MNIEIQVSDQLNDSRWDEFVAANRFSQHEQTSGFADSRKQVYRVFRILLLEENEIVGGAQLLVLPTPFGKIAEIRHGPLFREECAELIRIFVTALEKEVKRRSIVKVKVFSMGCNIFVEQTLEEMRFLPAESEDSLGATTIVDLTLNEEELLARMKKKTRYNIRYAGKKGVTVKIGDRSDIADFYEHYRLNSEVKNFPVYPIDYFYYLWDLFSGKEKIHLLIARADDSLQAAMILIPIGTRVCSLWSCSARVKPDRKAGYLLDWEAISMVKNLGYTEYDFCGTDPDSTSGFSDFKRSFGGNDYQYPDVLERYFGAFPKLSKRSANLVRSMNILNKVMQKYVCKAQPRLPF